MRIVSTSITFLALALMAGIAVCDENVSDFVLENGLEVVVIEDHRAPAAVQMIWYDVGAADEPPGKSGIAHFLEHLMFRGTEKYGPGEFQQTVELLGGSENGFTSRDYTGYWQRVASDRLETVMEMEADRMNGLLMTGEDISVERQVVLEERNQRTDSNPHALFAEQRMSALYLNHPYGIPVIGWRAEIEGLTRDDLFDFYRQHYVPNNATLIIAGDVQPDEVRQLAEEHYGQIPADPEMAERDRPTEPPHLAARRLAASDPRVASPYVVRIYLAPERNPGEQEKAAALEILAELLGGGGATSILGGELEIEEKIAVYTSAFYDGVSLDYATFGLLALPADGVTLQEAEDAVDEVLAEFIAEGVDEDHLARIKAQIRAAWIYGQDSVFQRANHYGQALASGLSIEDVETWPDVLEAVTGEDIVAVAREVLDIKSSVTGWLTGEEG